MGCYNLISKILFCIIFSICLQNGFCQKSQTIDIVPQIGHFTPPEIYCLSARGTYSASSGTGQLIIVKEEATGYELFRLYGHKSKVSSLVFSPDEQKLFSGSWDGTIKVWNLKNGTLQQELEGKIVHHSGKWMHGIANLLSPKKIKSNKTFDHIYKMLIDPDARYLIVNSRRGLRLYDFESLELLGWVTLNEWGSTEQVELIYNGDYLKYTTVSKLSDRAVIGRKTFRVDLDKLQKIELPKEKLVRAVTKAKETVPLAANSIQKDINFSNSNSLLFRDLLALYELRLENLSIQKRYHFPTEPRIVHYNQSLNALGILSGKQDFTLRSLQDTSRLLAHIQTPADIRNFEILDQNPSIFFMAGREIFEYYYQSSRMTFARFYDDIPNRYLVDQAKWPFSLIASQEDETESRLLGTSNGLVIWDVAEGKIKRRLTGPSMYYNQAFSNYPERNWDKGSNIRSMLRCGNSDHIICGAADGSLRLFSMRKKKSRKWINGHESAVTDLCYIEDLNSVVSSGAGGTLLNWQFLKPKRKNNFIPAQHPSGITDLSYDPKTKLLSSLGRDGTIKFWQLSEGGFTEVAQMIFRSPQAYSIVTPDGYYFNSQEFFQAFLFRINDKVFPPEQFDLKYNRPDLVLQRLGGSPDSLIQAYKEAYLKRLSRMNFTEDMLSEDFHLPDLTLLYASADRRTDEEEVSLLFEARDSLERLDRVNVYINDVPIYGINGIDLRSLKTHVYKDSLRLRLNPGDNKIQLSVLNQRGAESLRVNKEIVCERSAPKPDLYLISLGVAKFADEKFNLEYVEKDLGDFIDLFSADDDLYAQKHKFHLSNKELNPAALKQIKQQLLKSKINDKVILYVAGHGLFDRHFNYLLATYETNFDRPEGTGIPYEQLEAMLDSIPARNKLMLMDACHSGEIDTASIRLIEEKNTLNEKMIVRSAVKRPKYTDDGLSLPFELMKRTFIDLRRRTGATVISSASGMEFALEGNRWQNGVFIYCLRSVLNNLSDLDKDGKLMISELQQYLSREVSNKTYGLQTPTYRSRNIVNDWQLW
ncbi:MAG: WD40 repeat domain-containing protein [Bacteroidota bacterium]